MIPIKDKEFSRYLCSNSSSHLFTFLYPIGYRSAQFFRSALHYANGGRKFLHQSAQPPWGSVYIVIHRQTVSFHQNSSVWLDTSGARSRVLNKSVNFCANKRFSEALIFKTLFEQSSRTFILTQSKQWKETFLKLILKPHMELPRTKT